MDLYELDFAKIIVLRDDIAEVIINDGIELNEAMVDAYHQFLIEHLRAPFSLLINKINPYAYTFGAQQKIGTIDQINAMAVVAYNQITRRSTEDLADVPREKRWNMRIFSNREAALEWLISEQRTAHGA